MAIMDKACHAIAVDDHLGGHAPQAEEIDLLTIELEHLVVRIGQTNKRHRVFTPEALELLLIFWSNDDHNCIAVDKLLIVLAQLRHMLSAEWSLEAPVEDQDYGFTRPEVTQVDRLAVHVGKFEIWCDLVQFYSAHLDIS